MITPAVTRSFSDRADWPVSVADEPRPAPPLGWSDGLLLPDRLGVIVSHDLAGAKLLADGRSLRAGAESQNE